MNISGKIVSLYLKFYKSRPRDPSNVAQLRQDVLRFAWLVNLLWSMPKETVKEDITFKTVPGWHIQTQKPSKHTILYLHGGAYIYGFEHVGNMYKAFLANLSLTANANIWAPDYRLAPEYPFPAALEDSQLAYLTLLEKNIDPQTLFIMGDSAGGGLALALLLKLRDQGLPLPRGGITLSAWTDLAITGDSIITRATKDPLFNGDLLRGVVRHIVSEKNSKDPYISPLYGEYKGLPPLLMIVGGREILFDDTLRVVEKAKRAGVNVNFDIYEEMFHVFPLFSDVFPEGHNAINKIALFMNNNS
ncbi:MAG: alpha/beta hydrolase [Alphaproteobacteria bacterium]|nr:alpha/beta hydrolase [Alphaproteobacteria bacterium]